MKRPDGFDRAPGSRAPGADRPGRARSALLDPPREDSTPRDTRPAREQRPARGPGSPREPRPARIRSAKAELRAAARARRREEKAEIRRFTRRRRHRRLAATALGGTLLTLVLLVVVAVYSPLLQVRHIEITGTQRLDANQVRGAVDGQLGIPLALLDETRLTRELGAFPLVRSYSTEIVPPDTLVIRVVERTPVGALQDGSRFQLVDAAGVPIASSESRPAGTPLIQLPPSQGVEDEGFAAMAHVLSTLPPDLVARVDTVTATTSDDVAFTLTGTNQTVVWGSADDAQAKAQTLARIPEFVAGRSGHFSVASPGTATFIPS